MATAISHSSEIYRNLLMEISSSIVWKNTSLANSYEINTDPYYVELFIVSKRGQLNFDVIRSFDEEILNKAGLIGDQVYPMLVDKNKIPVSYRANLVELYRQRMIERDPVTGHYTYYQEENNYYRMLAGLPDVGDSDYIYVTKLNSDWPTNIPVHEMTIAQRLDMEKQGYLAELVAAHPDKKYLQYLGKKNIDIFNARVAERFDILHCQSDNSTFESDFKTIYGRNKMMVNRVYYSDAYRKSSNLYENFLAMCILFMTMLQMGYKYLETDTSRDFYDTESLKYIYDSYQVPFYSEIPLEYHVRIVKQMNRLIAYKGSSTVFFDLFDLFDSGSMNIYSYYMTKTHRFDEKGLPIFAKKEDGTPDYEAMYEVKFSKVKLFNDPALEIADPTNNVGYYDLVNTDPYWINDQQLLEKIYRENYNYMESKYIGIQTILDILSTTYENAYFIKMLQDNKAAMQSISVRWSATSSNVSIFDFFIYMAALYCKKFGYEGNIDPSLAFTAKVLGYNFKDHLKNFQDHIMKDPTLSKDSNLYRLISTMNVNSLNSVNQTFANITDLRKYLVTRFSNAHSREEYFLYRDLYDILLTSENIKDSFTKVDGSLASTYEDMLADTNADLYSRYALLDEESIDDEIRLVIMQLEKSIPSVRNLDSIFGLDVNSLIDSLFKILNFFKSEKAELVGYNIVFVMSLRGVNFFKMIDLINGFEEHIKLNPDGESLQDLMTQIDLMYSTYKDAYALIDQYELYQTTYFRDYINALRDDLHQAIMIIEDIFPDQFIIQDFITSILSESVLRFTHMPFNDTKFTLHEEYIEPKYKGTIKDQFEKLIDTLIALPEKEPTHHKSMMELIDISVSILSKVQKYGLHSNLTLEQDQLKILRNQSAWSRYLSSHLANWVDKASQWNVFKSSHQSEINMETHIDEILVNGSLLDSNSSSLTIGDDIHAHSSQKRVVSIQFSDSLRELV